MYESAEVSSIQLRRRTRNNFEQTRQNDLISEFKESPGKVKITSTFELDSSRESLKSYESDISSNGQDTPTEKYDMRNSPESRAEVHEKQLQQPSFVVHKIKELQNALSKLKEFDLKLKKRHERVSQHLLEHRDCLVQRLEDYAQRMRDATDRHVQHQRQQLRDYIIDVHECLNLLSNIQNVPSDQELPLRKLLEAMDAQREIFNVFPTGGADFDFIAADIQPGTVEAVFGHLEGVAGNLLEMSSERRGKSAVDNSICRISRVDSIASFNIESTALLCLNTFSSRTDSDSRNCRPTSIKVDADARIWCVDDINKKVKLFDMNGQLTRELTSPPNHPFVDPWDVALVGTELIALSDRGPTKEYVRVFTRDGVFLHSFGAGMASAWGLAVNSQQHIIVADCVGRCVHCCQVDGTIVRCIKPTPSPGMQSHFLCPEYVAVNSRDEIIVSDLDLNCVNVFTSQGEFLHRLGSGGKREGELYVPCGVAVDAEDNVYCADYNNCRVQFFSNRGASNSSTHVTEVSRVLLCGLRAPQCVAIHGDYLIVLHRADISVYQLPELEFAL